eukprot:CAMPEP_0183393698 /NCGR_PEP_ID=MMETSP0370-20130417/8091_1 /TAXON_ID=268820 /ORGANISM="Peridinium aciculiferum, Strain PAER-2" /LENGTH=303 /DNA_ID=CAMNT_0025573951 /DNA_START=111 /DNA_END=1022 /DNA_ORIENTATION=-
MPSKYTEYSTPQREFGGASDAHRSGNRSQLRAALEQGGADAKVAIAELQHAMPALAFDAEGCDLVLEALDRANAQEMLAMAATFRGSVPAAACSQHAHQVLERLLHDLSGADAGFVAEELLGRGRELAFDQYGSSVICQLLLFAQQNHGTHALVDEVLSADVTAVCHHKQGHQVALATLEHGLPQHRHRIFVSLLPVLDRATKHRFAAELIATALLQCRQEEANALAIAVLGTPGVVATLACHCFGAQIVRSLLQIRGIGSFVMQQIARSEKKMRKDKYASELLQELGVYQGSTLAVARRGGA